MPSASVQPIGTECLHPGAIGAWASQPICVDVVDDHLLPVLLVARLMGGARCADR
jgi:hypothetical protein